MTAFSSSANTLQVMEYVMPDKRHSQKRKQRITEVKMAHDNPTGVG
jgi:hypothetical protein